MRKGKLLTRGKIFFTDLKVSSRTHCLLITQDEKMPITSMKSVNIQVINENLFAKEKRSIL